MFIFAVVPVFFFIFTFVGLSSFLKKCISAGLNIILVRIIMIVKYASKQQSLESISDESSNSFELIPAI